MIHFPEYSDSLYAHMKRGHSTRELASSRVADAIKFIVSVYAALLLFVLSVAFVTSVCGSLRS